jgi:hypothetical protein
MLLLGMVFLLASCEKKESNENAESIPPADTSYAANAISSSSAAIENGRDTSRKFIRTAEMKFRVKDVIEATYNIEDITAHFGGFVTYTNLSSTSGYPYTTKLSADSSLETTHYTVVNTMTLRVPNTKLDSTLKSIGKLVEYMDFRIIKAEDVGLQLLSNQLTEARIRKHENRLNEAIIHRGKKLQETTEAEENLYYKQEQADNARIANLSYKDQIQYSTVNLNIYQKEVLQREMVPNENNTDLYEPGFGKKLVESVHDGWKIFEVFILFIIRLWGLIIFVIVLLILFKKYRNRLKK